MIDNSRLGAMLLRKYGKIISDEERDELYEIVGDLAKLAVAVRKLGAPFNPREAELLAKVVGNMNDGTNFEKDGDLWRDDVLNRYAEFVHNYEYQYNDSAHDVDPNIDTEEVHIGPMAQDLEKVNPAVVIEDDSGYKTVDTGRLALMNAGAIAELAREIEEIKNG